MRLRTLIARVLVVGIACGAAVGCSDTRRDNAEVPALDVTRGEAPPDVIDAVTFDLRDFSSIDVAEDSFEVLQYARLGNRAFLLARVNEGPQERLVTASLEDSEDGWQGLSVPYELGSLRPIEQGGPRAIIRRARRSPGCDRRLHRSGRGSDRDAQRDR